MLACPKKSVWLENDTRILTSAPYPKQESALEKCESISCPGSLFHFSPQPPPPPWGGSGKTRWWEAACKQCWFFFSLSFVSPAQSPGKTLIQAKHLSALSDNFRRFIMHSHPPAPITGIAILVVILIVKTWPSLASLDSGLSV